MSYPTPGSGLYLNLAAHSVSTLSGAAARWPCSISCIYMRVLNLVACTRREKCKGLKVLNVELHVALRGCDRQVGLKWNRHAHSVRVIRPRRRQVCSSTT